MWSFLSSFFFFFCFAVLFCFSVLSSVTLIILLWQNVQINQQRGFSIRMSETDGNQQWDGSNKVKWSRHWWAENLLLPHFDQRIISAVMLWWTDKYWLSETETKWATPCLHLAPHHVAVTGNGIGLACNFFVFSLVSLLCHWSASGAQINRIWKYKVHLTQQLVSAHQWKRSHWLIDDWLTDKAIMTGWL